MRHFKKTVRLTPEDTIGLLRLIDADGAILDTAMRLDVHTNTIARMLKLKRASLDTISRLRTEIANLHANQASNKPIPHYKKIFNVKIQ